MKPSITPATSNPYKSRGETQIARCLDRNKIEYFYEHPLAVIDRGRPHLWYPDFQLPRYGILIEYFGRQGDAEYRKGMQRKQAVYNQNRLNAIFITPQFFKGNWPDRLLDRIQATLTDRLNEFRKIRYDCRYSQQQSHSRDLEAAVGEY